MAKHKKIMASALRFVVHALKNLFLPEFFFIISIAVGGIFVKTFSAL